MITLIIKIYILLSYPIFCAIVYYRLMWVKKVLTHKSYMEPIVGAGIKIFKDKIVEMFNKKSKFEKIKIALLFLICFILCCPVMLPFSINYKRIWRKTKKA